MPKKKILRSSTGKAMVPFFCFKGVLMYQIFIERTDAEAEAPILWPPDVKS